MGIVLLSINGIGLGHITRMTQIADQLYASGSKPILLYQNKKYPFNNKLFHKTKVDNLFKAQPAYLRAVEAKVNAACNICEPRIFIEDTHPASIKLSSNIARFLLIRPTTLEYLQKIVRIYERDYDAFFIADHIDSPTWPYNDEETAEISSWQKCFQVGPVFRSASPEEVEAIKIKYNWQQDVPLYVFSMGGGGQQAGANDVEIFLKESQPIIHQLRSAAPLARFLFVKGPLFPPGISLPAEVEAIDTEESMPALFAIARAAIIRPGFNSIWECIHAQTPFYYIEGTTFSEPITQKMKKLAALGLSSNKEAFTEFYRRSYATSCKHIMQQWNGKPSDLFFSVIEKAHANKSIATRRVLESASDHSSDQLETAIHSFRKLAALCTSKKIFLRIDDVVSMTPELDFILTLAKELNIFSSLEVIPYLSNLKEEALLPYDPECGKIIISQHGYAHVLNTDNPHGIKSEFSFTTAPPDDETQNLLAGKKYLEQQFPNRFRQGFSAPFDCFPPWLPAMLQANSWKYLHASQTTVDARIKTINAAIDIWDWRQSQMKPFSLLFANCINACMQQGYFSLTLHPILLDPPGERELVRILLTEFKKAGFESYDLENEI